MTAAVKPRPAARDVVTFHLGKEVLAVPATHLREVLEPVAITRVPGAPDFVSRLINVRGTVVPLADLRVPLRMPLAAQGAHARIMVLDLTLDGQDAVVGIFADSVHEVTHLSADDLEDIPPVGTRWPPRFVEAVGRWGGAFVTIPDLAAIFAEFLTGQIGRTTLGGARTASANQPEPEFP